MSVFAFIYSTIFLTLVKKRLQLAFLAIVNVVVSQKDRYQNIQFQNAQKNVFRIYFINGASNKKMVLGKNLSFLDFNTFCFME